MLCVVVSSFPQLVLVVFGKIGIFKSRGPRTPVFGVFHSRGAVIPPRGVVGLLSPRLSGLAGARARLPCEKASERACATGLCDRDTTRRGGVPQRFGRFSPVFSTLEGWRLGRFSLVLNTWRRGFRMGPAQ